MVLLDRKGPRVFVVSNLHMPNPQAELFYDDSCGMEPPLQAGAWPVCGMLGSPRWDMTLELAVDGRLPLVPDSVYKELPIAESCCFFGTGSQVWLGSVSTGSNRQSASAFASSSLVESSRGLYCVANLAMIHPKFLLHDILPLTSNTLLVLNRHSQNTGLWQVTSNNNWAECRSNPSSGNGSSSSTAFQNLSKLTRTMNSSSSSASSGGRDSFVSADGSITARFVGGLPSWKGPHGMVLAPDRRSVLVVDTGAACEQGCRGGVICHMSLSLTVSGEVCVGSIRELQECSPAGMEWNPLARLEEEEAEGSVPRDPCNVYAVGGSIVSFS